MHHAAFSGGSYGMSKVQETQQTQVDYANMARELRRLATQVTGMAAQLACKTLAAQYDELAKGSQKAQH